MHDATARTRAAPLFRGMVGPRRLAWAGFAALSLVATGQAQDPNFHIYLGLGQSNMEGGPRVNGLPQVDPRFQVMPAINCPNLNPPRTQGEWYPANPPLPRCSAGPGIVDWFGRTLIDSLPSNIKIGVIMVTIVGTKIEVFDKDGHQDYLGAPTTEDWLRNLARDFGNNPYGRLIDLAKVAQEDGVIKGILLHQGESNVGDNQWPNKVKKIYDDMMADLSLDPAEIPLLAGEVVNADMNGTAAGANTQINRLPQVLPNSHVISSSKIPAGGDNLHFSAEGHQMFGKRYAAKMLSLLDGATSLRPGERPETGFALEAKRLGSKAGRTEIAFTLPRRSKVALKAFTPAGREVAEPAAGEFPAGSHRFTWSGPLPTGLNLLKMEADGQTLVRRVWVD